MTRPIFTSRLSAIVCAAFLSGGATFAAPPLVIKTAEFPRPAKAPLGINLEPVVDYSHSMMFVDLIKQARQFGSADAPWKGTPALDANGWPTGDAGLVVATGSVIPAGDYLFSCSGRCTVVTMACKASVSLQTYDRDKNITTATVTVEPNADSLFLGFKNTYGGIQNIRLLRPGYARDSKQTFSKEFLDAIAPFSTLRMMDYLRTNETTVKEWKDRAKPTDPLQSSTRGSAWEYAIQLANETHKDLWINVPVGASDDYVKQLALLLKAKLDKNRVVYVEYSNEVWNSIFPQFRADIDAAEAEVAAGDTTLSLNGADINKYYWGWRRVAKRIVAISNIFKAAYAGNPAAINTVIRPVLASQIAQPLVLRTQLEYIAQYDGPPAKFIYAVAGAPYFSAAAAVADKKGVTADELLQSAADHSLPGNKKSEIQYQTLARFYRLHSLCYEGGPDFSGEKNLKEKIAAQFKPRMKDIIKQDLEDWYGTGGELFMYFNIASSYNKYGCWGLSDDVRKPSLKTDAIKEVLAAPLPPVTAGFALPGTVPATGFIHREGGGIEKWDDGSQHIAYTKADNFFDYLVNVQSTGDYIFTLQTATAVDTAAIEVLLSSDSLGTIPIKNGHLWTKWVDSDPIPLHLEKGQLTVRLKVIQGGANINSFTFQKK